MFVSVLDITNEEETAFHIFSTSLLLFPQFKQPVVVKRKLVFPCLLREKPTVVQYLPTRSSLIREKKWEIREIMHKLSPFSYFICLDLSLAFRCYPVTERTNRAYPQSQVLSSQKKFVQILLKMESDDLYTIQNPNPKLQPYRISRQGRLGRACSRN